MQYYIEEKGYQKIEELLNQGRAPLTFLRSVPEAAREPRMLDALVKGLSTLPLQDRGLCARILEYIGDPRGIDHLVYNTLLYHPLLKYNQKTEHDWGFYALRFADKLNEQQVQLLIDDMVENQIVHAPILAYAKTENIVPAMLKLLDKGQKLKRLAAYVLAYHGHDQGVKILKDWTVNSPKPSLPLAALSQLSDDVWVAFTEPFASLNHPIYTKDDYYAKNSVLYPAQVRLKLQKLAGLSEKSDYIIMLYGELKETIEVYIGNPKGDTAAHRVNPPVTVLAKTSVAIPGVGPFLQNILADLRKPSLQAYLADKQRNEVRNLIERAGLHFKNSLSFSLSGLAGIHDYRSVGGLYPTGFLKKDENWGYFKVIYDTDDYLNAVTDWIVNPIRHLSVMGYTKIEIY